jgi:hypothetical protein
VTASLLRHGAPLLRDSDFQAAWYYSMLLFAGIVVALVGLYFTVRELREMWVRGDRGLALGVGGAAAVAFLMYASMLVTVAIAMLPLAYRGGAG